MELRQAGFVVYGLSDRAQRTLSASTIEPRSIFVLGNETEGVTPEAGALVDRWLGIPMVRGGDSLNVAAAAAVVGWELVRRSDEA